MSTSFTLIFAPASKTSIASWLNVEARRRRYKLFVVARFPLVLPGFSPPVEAGGMPPVIKGALAGVVEEGGTTVPPLVGAAAAGGGIAGRAVAPSPSSKAR